MPNTVTEAWVDVRPMCEIHKMGTVELVPAAYDGKTGMGPWAFMCEDCFLQYGLGLGLGLGQRLMVRGDSPGNLQE